MSDKTNVLPNNLEAEQALLGCMLIDSDVLSEVADKLTDRDFYHESHQLIMSAILKVFNQRKPADIVTLSDCLEKEGNLEKVGGIDYITELMQKVPSAANYKYYFNIVKRDSTNRELIRASRNIIENSMNSADATKSVQYAEKLIYGETTTGTQNDIKRATDLARQMVCEWGMSPLGFMAFGAESEPIFIGRELSHHKDYSEGTALKIDDEIRLIMKQCYERTESILKSSEEPQIEIVSDNEENSDQSESTPIESEETNESDKK